MHSIIIYILVAALITYLIRMLPLVLLRKKIKNSFIRSFLYYVPYVTLAVMTFPAILTATGSVISGAAGLIVALIMAFMGMELLPVAIGASVAALICELITTYLIL